MIDTPFPLIPWSLNREAVTTWLDSLSPDHRFYPDHPYGCMLTQYLYQRDTRFVICTSFTVVRYTSLNLGEATFDVPRWCQLWMHLCIVYADSILEGPMGPPIRRDECRAILDLVPAILVTIGEDVTPTDRSLFNVLAQYHIDRSYIIHRIS